MPSAAIDIAELKRYIDAIVGICATPNAQEPLRKAIQVAVGELGRSMIRGQSPDGTPHRPLSPAYLRRRENKSGPPLINLGDMMQSLIADGSGHIEQITDDDAILGTVHNKNDSDPPVAIVHQLGSRKRNIPARPFVGVNAAMADATAALIADHIAQRIHSIS